MDINRKKRFVPTKLQHLIVHIVRTLSDVSRLKLAKLIYLIDWEHYLRTGEQLTKAFYIRQKMGPLITGLDNAIDKLDRHEIKFSKNPFSGYHHQIGARPRFEPKFTLQEIATIEEELKKYCQLNNETLQNIAYDTRPMLDILKEESEKCKRMLNIHINFKKYPTRDPLQKYRKLAEKIDFSVHGSQKERSQEFLSEYYKTQNLRKRATTSALHGE